MSRLQLEQEPPLRFPGDSGVSRVWADRGVWLERDSAMGLEAQEEVAGMVAVVAVAVADLRCR